MSLLLTTIELSWLVLAAGYLWYKHRQRVRKWTLQEDPQKWTGHGIEVRTLRPRLEQVRQDYSVARQPARVAAFHRSLLELARRAVTQLRYFRRSETEAGPT